MNREVYRYEPEEKTEENNEAATEDFNRPEDLSKSVKSVEDLEENLSEGDNDKDEVDDCEKTTFHDEKTNYPEDKPDNLLEDLPDAKNEIPHEEDFREIGDKSERVLAAEEVIEGDVEVDASSIPEINEGIYEELVDEDNLEPVEEINEILNSAKDSDFNEDFIEDFTEDFKTVEMDDLKDLHTEFENYKEEIEEISKSPETPDWRDLLTKNLENFQEEFYQKLQIPNEILKTIKSESKSQEERLKKNLVEEMENLLRSYSMDFSTRLQQQEDATLGCLLDLQKKINRILKITKILTNKGKKLKKNEEFLHQKQRKAIGLTFINKIKKFKTEAEIRRKEVRSARPIVQLNPYNRLQRPPKMPLEEPTEEIEEIIEDVIEPKVALKVGEKIITEVEPEIKPEVEFEHDAVVVFENEDEVLPEEKIETEAEIELEVEPDVGPEVITESKPEVEPEVKFEAYQMPKTTISSRSTVSLNFFNKPTQKFELPPTHSIQPMTLELPVMNRLSIRHLFHLNRQCVSLNLVDKIAKTTHATMSINPRILYPTLWLHPVYPKAPNQKPEFGKPDTVYLFWINRNEKGESEIDQSEDRMRPVVGVHVMNKFTSSISRSRPYIPTNPINKPTKPDKHKNDQSDISMEKSRDDHLSAEERRLLNELKSQVNLVWADRLKEVTNIYNSLLLSHGHHLDSVDILIYSLALLTTIVTIFAVKTCLENAHFGDKNDVGDKNVMKKEKMPGKNIDASESGVESYDENATDERQLAETFQELQGVKNQLAELEKILTCETPVLQQNLRCPTKTEEEVSDAIFDEATTSMTSESTEVTTSLSEEGLEEIRRKTPEEHLISALFDVERIQESNIEGEISIYSDDVIIT